MSNSAFTAALLAFPGLRRRRAGESAKKSPLKAGECYF
jgi:hypothetical protein